MPKPSSHTQSSPCPLAHALDLIGDRWTLLIVRDLMLRDRHEYKDFLQSYEGISTNILADRLQRLLQAGLIKSIPHPDNRTRKLYYLTPAGKALIRPMVELVKWSAEHLATAPIPPDLAPELRDDPEDFIRKMLDRLEQWETENLSGVRSS